MFLAIDSHGKGISTFSRCAFSTFPTTLNQFEKVMKRILQILLLLTALAPLSIHSQTVSTFVPGNAGIDDALLTDSLGNLYGSGYMNGNLYKVSPSGVSSLFASGFSAANGLAWDGQGNLTLCDNTGNNIYKIAPDTSVSVFLSITGPSGLTKDPLSDTLYFTTYPGQRVYKIAPDTNYIQVAVGNGLNGPVGLAWDDNNDLLIGNFTDGKVFRLKRGTTSITEIGQFPGGICGFIAYKEGYVYGSMFNLNQIYRMDSLGNTQWVAGSLFGQVDGPAATARFSRPNGITFSRGGDSLFISDFNAKSIRIITGLDSIGLVSRADSRDLSYELQVVPNPSYGKMRIDFATPQGDMVEFSLVDVQGREAMRLEAESYPIGRHSLQLDATALPRGLYFLVMDAGDLRRIHKVVLR